MSRRWPFLIPFVFMTVGMSLSALTGFCADNSSVAAVFLCLLLACFLPYPVIFPVCTAIFFFFWGLTALNPWLIPDQSPHSIRIRVSDRPIAIEGVISARPSVAAEGSRLVVQVEGISSGTQMDTASGLMLLNVTEGDVDLARGDRIRFISRVSLPRRLGLAGEFDYERYLSLQGVSVIGRVASRNEIVLIRAAAVESMQRSIDRAARFLGDTIRKAVPAEYVSSVLTALLIGDQRRIPRDLADAYTRAGVTHILSISGFHVGIIAAFITVLVIWILSRNEYIALRWNVRRIAVLIAVPAMLAYLLLTGNAPATARSVIMLTVFAAALFSEREQDSVNTLLLAAFLLVAFNPPTLFDVSFQLSFLSLWGILITVPLIATYTGRVQSTLLSSMIQLVAASIAASCVTLIPVLYIFKVASFNGILTNFVIVPLLGYGAVLAGFIVLPFIGLFPSVAPVLLWPAAAMIDVSNCFVMWCSSLPVITFHGITGHDVFFFLLFMAAVTFVINRTVRQCLVLLIPVTALSVHLYAAVASDGRLHITMLSVGQAESILVRLPDGSTLLVDGGGYLHDTGQDFGQRFLAPALGAMHVLSIDRMIATHDHPDHSGGLPFVIKNFAVGEFWSGANVNERVLNELSLKKVPRRTVMAGDVISLPGPVVITVLSPEGSASAAADSDELSVNEQSLVFRLSYGAFSMIFCADAGFEAEQRILDGRYELKATVLKVGHHGSRFSTSEEFLSQVNPEVALISVGSGNRFGLPSARTVDLLSSRGIPVHRTDREGTIELVSDGRSWSVTHPHKPE